MNTKVSHSIVTEPPVWFITGCSTGFGLELAKQCRERLDAAQQQVMVLEGEVLKPLGGLSSDLQSSAADGGERD